MTKEEVDELIANLNTSYLAVKELVSTMAFIRYQNLNTSYVAVKV